MDHIKLWLPLTMAESWHHHVPPSWRPFQRNQETCSHRTATAFVIRIGWMAVGMDWMTTLSEPFLCFKYHLTLLCQRRCCFSSTRQTTKILHKQSHIYHTRNYHWQQYKNTTHWKITRNTFMWYSTKTESGTWRYLLLLVCDCLFVGLKAHLYHN